MSDYLREALLVPKLKVFLMFTVVSITAPIIGVIVGGHICEKLGGYTSEHAITFC